MNQPYIVGITGGSGSGKTSFLKALEGQFSESEICVLSQDEYYKPMSEQYVDASGKCNFDLPSSFDEKAYETDILSLVAGKTITKEEYTFNNINATPKLLTFKSAPILLIEGLFVFHFQAIAELMDLKVFVDARDDLKIIRRIMRDATERNYPLDDVVYRFEHHVTPAYEKYILPYRQTADLVVNNSTNFNNALAVITAFLKTKLA